MSIEPPSSGRPAGPPSGPLSGPSRPGAGGPPSGPSGGSAPGSGGPPSGSGEGPGPGGPPPGPPSGPGGTGGSGGAHEGPPGDAGGPGGPQRPWWRSAPRVAAISLLVVAAVVVTVVLTRPGGSGSDSAEGEVFLQAASADGPDPFTGSTARDTSPAPAPSTSKPAPSASGTNVTRAVGGATPGLYGGTRDVASCDVEQQIRSLGADPSKNEAFAGAQDISPGQVPAYLRSLTPVQLRMDTRVTNHGFRDGKATPYQAVLQSGTAVLVDDRGIPRVRCACGNPLRPPVAQETTPKQTGTPWPGYRASQVVVVTPAPRDVETFVLYDPKTGEWIARPAGDTGKHDKKTEPPERTSPSPSTRTPSDGTTEPGTSCPPGGGPACPGDESGPASDPATEPPPGESPQSPAPEEPPPASEAPPGEQSGPAAGSDAPAPGSEAPASPG
ncbi:DUF6777 domain-containing protein [Streptomyces zhihengii]